MSYYRTGGGCCKTQSGGGGTITVSNLDQLSDAGLVAKAIFGSNLAPAVSALTVEGIALSNALYAVAATALWGSNNAALGPDPYNDAAVVASAAYGSNTAHAVSNEVYGPVTTALAGLTAADAALSNALYAVAATALWSSNNAALGPDPYDDSHVVAQATYGSNASSSLSNVVYGTVTSQLASLAAADLTLSNVLFAALAPTQAKAEFASNAVWVTSNVLFDDVIPDLDAVTVTAEWASNNVAAGGGGDAAPSGWRVTSNASAYTLCNVGVKTSTPGYDLSVIGTTGTQRLVVSRTMEGVPDPDDTTLTDAVAWSSNTAWWSSNNVGAGGGAAYDDAALVAQAAFGCNAGTWASNLLAAEGFAEEEDASAALALATEALAVGEYASNALPAIDVRSTWASNAVAAVVPYDDASVVAKAAFSSNTSVWASNGVDAVLMQLFGVEVTADYSSNALPAISARAAFGSNLGVTVTANTASIAALMTQASWTSNALPAIDARGSYASNAVPDVIAAAAAAQVTADYSSNALPTIDARASFGSNLSSTVTANTSAIATVTAQATWTSNALPAIDARAIYGSNLGPVVGSHTTSNAALATQASFSSNALPAIDARATFGSNLGVTVTANTASIATVTTQAAFGSNTGVSACNIAIAASNQAYAGGGGGASSAGLVFISTVSAASGAAQVAFSNLGTTYNNYELVFNGAMALTDGTDLYLQMSSNNGSTWFTSGAYNGGNTQRRLDTGVTNWTASTNQFLLGRVVNNASYPNFSGVVTMYGLGYSSPGGALYTQVNGRSVYKGSSSTVYYTTDIGGVGPSNVNAVRLTWSSGSHFTGTYTIYGFKS